MCQFPLVIQMPTASQKTGKMFRKVPCSICPSCRKTKINQWAHRLEMELKRSYNPLFVTLTYDPENVPYGDGCMSLYKRDLQLFFKSLRYLDSKQKKSFKYEKRRRVYLDNQNRIKYYAVGEYGSKTHRPHYHIILFNLADPSLVGKAWGKGFVLPLPLTDGGIRYTLKYMSKPRKHLEGRQQEFSLMSKRLGDNYLTAAVIHYHLSDLRRCYVHLPGGIKMPMARYYKDKIYSDPEIRAKVTVILQNRIDALLAKAVKSEMINYNLNEFTALRNLELSKLFTKFEKRKTEVL